MQTEQSITPESEKWAADFCMIMGLFLGMWFIGEYMLVVLTARNIFFSMLHTAMSAGIPICLFAASCVLRKRAFVHEFSWYRCWNLGVRIVCYATLFEAAFIMIYNKWIDPTNLYTMQSGLLSQYESMTQMLQSQGGLNATMVHELDKSIALMKEAGTPTPGQAAFSAVTTNLTAAIFWMTIVATLCYRRKQNNQ